MQAISSPTLQPAVSVKPMTLEDPLAYLPFSKIRQHGKHEAIYIHGQAATSLYLVVEGKVKILRHASLAVVLDVYRSDELFGESVLAGQAYRVEQAVATEPTRLMSWSREEIEEAVKSRPKLALALLQLMAGRLVEFANRIDSFSRESIEQRLRRTLVRLATRFGNEGGDGTVKMDAFTHEFLSQYVGTSREIVSHYMNRFKREGYLQYSRREISLQQHALTAWQTAQSTTALRRSAALTN
jgi:CRP/FNR family transcriptional regulator, cyclic AMP receptor protein